MCEANFREGVADYVECRSTPDPFPEVSFAYSDSVVIDPSMTPWMASSAAVLTSSGVA